MMRRLLLVLALLCSLQAGAQLPTGNLVHFGVEWIKGNYTGVSDMAPDDRYRLMNLATMKLEFVSPKSNYLFDFSWASMALFNLKNDWPRGSAYSEEAFQKVHNRSLIRFCNYRMLGRTEAKGPRLGLGWQFDLRKFGINSPAVPQYPLGPLLYKNRPALGVNLHVADSWGKWMYTRLSVFADYIPGKLKGFSVYPEWTVVLKRGFFGVFATASYRSDWMKGHIVQSQEVGRLDHLNSTHRFARLELGISLQPFF